MKYNRVLSIALLASAAPCHALELDIAPRFEAGAMVYEFQQNPLNSPGTLNIGTQVPVSLTRLDKIEFASTLPFVSGGVTLFTGPFFLDFDVQHAFAGQDDSRIGVGFKDPNGTFGGTGDLNGGARFDRTEWSFSLGYGITDYLAIYAGYKKTDTEFDVDMTGRVETLAAGGVSVPLPQASGTVAGQIQASFEYDGPFVGAGFSWPLKMGAIDGALSGNVAVAFLDGIVDQTGRNTVLMTQTGTAIPLPIRFLNLDGTATGVSVGVSWKGLTAIDGLTYSLGANGYTYDFQSDKTGDVEETIIRVHAGISYAMNLF